MSGSSLAAQEESAKALAAEALKNRTDPRAGLVAYETAWTLVRLGHVADARAVAELALDLPASEEHPTKARRALLARYIAWKLADDEAEDSLDDALELASAEPPNLLTNKVFQERYLAEFELQRWRKAAAVASAAAQYTEEQRTRFLDFWAWSKLISLISEFYSRPKLKTLRDMAHLHGQLEADAWALEEVHRPYWLIDIINRTHAWRLTMEAYYAHTERRSSKRLKRQMREIVSAYLPPEVMRDRKSVQLAFYKGAGDAGTGEGTSTVKNPASRDDIKQPLADSEGDSDAQRLCEGALLDDPPLRYPAAARWKGQFGSVILAFKLNDGELADLEVLASVPEEGFKEEVLKTVSQWRYVASDDAERPCSLDSPGLLLPLIFIIR